MEEPQITEPSVLHSIMPACKSAEVPMAPSTTKKRENEQTETATTKKLKSGTPSKTLTPQPIPGANRTIHKGHQTPSLYSSPMAETDVDIVKIWIRILAKHVRVNWVKNITDHDILKQKYGKYIWDNKPKINDDGELFDLRNIEDRKKAFQKYRKIILDLLEKQSGATDQVSSEHVIHTAEEKSLPTCGFVIEPYEDVSLPSHLALKYVHLDDKQLDQLAGDVVKSHPIGQLAWEALFKCETLLYAVSDDLPR